ncbi:CehA/McbA family metallohydrolase [Massilia niastensis]|uniref:CehA/McbA family metallohydrolase n=1 Tax=Massilia niastensis TaxID=544911 RepID=UPI000372FD8D|nr:CehA/McbA family metallohydrolase [Massilia niastensis]
MTTSLLPPILPALWLCGSLAAAAPAALAEHREFEATLHAPFQSGPVQQRRFLLDFAYPGLEQAGIVDWRVTLEAPGGRVLLRWQGQTALKGPAVSVPVPWSGRIGRAPAPGGIYRVRLHAALRGEPHEVVEQDWEIAVGAPPAPRLPRFEPLPRATSTPGAAPAPAALPYTVYLGNLHSQTNHSDGGAELAACKGAQPPQSARHGPEAAFAYARERGLDILVASEHNHMYDGSETGAPQADAAAARALYQSGLAAADAFSAAHPGFLALYGMEWGVINNGGHINIFDSRELLGWETNARGELMADTLTARGDYASLYTLMRERGWVGQFNHPAQTGQFIVNGVALGYTRDGDEAMALCEVMNSTAFSTNVTETETRRSQFEAACNRLLEAGYHLAFSSNQDNHCANWGASYTNRTAVLIPNGVALTRASFVEALKARRVFATMDRESQLVLTANGRLMGERFTNRGPLTLVANFASTGGRKVASVALMEGMPGRGGTVTRLSSSATTTIVPAPGAHFYYARITQDDGNVLWSAPVWVTQE